MMPRTVPVYPGPLEMTADEHYEYVESRAIITEDDARIVVEGGITVNIEFGTTFEERHSEDCACPICRDVEKAKMGRTTVITGGNGEVFGESDGEGEDGDGEGEDDDDDDEDGGVGALSSNEVDDEHDGEVIFAGTGKMVQVKITKPTTPAKHRLQKSKESEASTSTSTVHTDGTSNSARSVTSLHALHAERATSEFGSMEVSGSDTSGVAIGYSHSPSYSFATLPDAEGSFVQKRGRSISKDLHATWDPLIKSKEGLASRGLGAMTRSLSKRSLSSGKEKHNGGEGSGSNRTSKVWRFARTLSRRSINSGHSSQTRKEAKEYAKVEGRKDDGGDMDGGFSSSFEGPDLQTSFRGDSIAEHGEEATSRVAIRSQEESPIGDFPEFNLAHFGSGRGSVSGSNISTPKTERAVRKRSPSLRSKHYSARGSLSFNWENISSDTVYHKHARRFYANPAAYGEEIPGYNPETDNPYLEYDRYREVSEWADSTEEVDPDHVVALTTRELKRLCGDEVKTPFDFIPEGYVNPPNSKHSSVCGDDDDTILGDEFDKEPEVHHKNLISLLGMPGWSHQWEDMTKMQRHFHIVAAGDWRMGPVFDLRSNYSDYYGVPLFEPSDAGCYGVNRKDVRGLDVPGLEELELKFKMNREKIEAGHAFDDSDQGADTDEDIDQESPAEYDSDGFLYDDDIRPEDKNSYGATSLAGAEAARIYRRPTVGNEGSEGNKYGEGSEAGDYAGSEVEGFGTTDDHRAENGPNNLSFRARMAKGHTVAGRFNQGMFTPSNPGSFVSQDSYDTFDDEEESEGGEFQEYSFGNSSYHGTECQDDFVIGTSKFVPHAFQLYPEYEAAKDPTTIGITPDEVEAARPQRWDTNFMEDILGYSANESHKPRDPTAEMVLMSYLDPVNADGSKTRSGSSAGSTTPNASPSKSTKLTKPFAPMLRSIPRPFKKNTSNHSESTPVTNTARKFSLSSANISKLENKSQGLYKSKAKSSKGSKGKGHVKRRWKGKGKAKPPPSVDSSESDSNTSYVDLTRPGSSFSAPPAQSLILYLYGHGIGANHIAFLLQPLSQKFLYDSSSSWWPLSSPHTSTTHLLLPTDPHNLSTTPLSTSVPAGTLATPIRFPPHHLFTPTTVNTILRHCAGEKQWWEGPDAVDPDGHKLPETFKKLQRGMAMRKAETLIRKVVENFLFWRLRGERPHQGLMKG